jgi:hypothetical protein
VTETIEEIQTSTVVLVEVGGVFVNEFGKRPPILGIKVLDKDRNKLQNKDICKDNEKFYYKDYVAFKNTAKLADPEQPDFFVYEHSTEQPIKAVGVVWKLYSKKGDVNLSIKINGEYLYAIPRNKDDSTRNGAFALVAYEKWAKTEYLDNSEVPLHSAPIEFRVDK